MLHKIITRRMCVALFAGFFLVFSSTVLQAETAPPKEDGVPTIAVVYHQSAAVLFSPGIHYQCFVRNFQRHWERLAEEKGFNLMVIQGGSVAGAEATVMRTIVAQGVDGILSCFLDPALSESIIQEIHAAGIPVVALGMEPGGGVKIPYVGTDDYTAAFALGRETALLFISLYGNEKPNILISNSRMLTVNHLREEGFVSGFAEVLPEGEVIARPRDDGSIDGAYGAIRIDLNRYPETNVIFGTNDYRAYTALSALRSLKRGTIRTEIIAGFGGSLPALERLTDKENAWRVQSAVSFRETAETAYGVLRKMMDGVLPIRNTARYIVEPVIFVDPARQEVEDFIDENFIAE